MRIISAVIATYPSLKKDCEPDDNKRSRAGKMLWGAASGPWAVGCRLLCYTKSYGNTKFDTRVGVHQNFLEKLFLSRWRHHSDITAVFPKNDFIFAMTSQTVQILYICLLSRYWIIKSLSQSRYVTKNVLWRQLSKILAKICSGFRVTYENLKNWATFRYLSTFKLSGVICHYIWLKMKLNRNRNLIFLKGFITKKREGGKCPPPPCKVGLNVDWRQNQWGYLK